MPRRARDPNVDQVVYFCQSANKRYVKIGYTCNLKARLAYIACDVKYGWDWEKKDYAPPYTVVGFLAGAYELEQSLHDRFDKFRVSKKNHYAFREWFYLRGDLANFILYQTIPFTGYDERGLPLGIQNIQLPLFPSASSEEQSA